MAAGISGGAGSSSDSEVESSLDGFIVADDEVEFVESRSPTPDQGDRYSVAFARRGKSRRVAAASPRKKRRFVVSSSPSLSGAETGAGAGVEDCVQGVGHTACFGCLQIMELRREVGELRQVVERMASELGKVSGGTCSVAAA